MIQPFDSLMLRVLLRPLVACLQIFAAYVAFHGHTSPGGGFQGGVLLGCSLILPILVHGHRRPHARLSERGAAAVACVGGLAFAVAAALPVMFGAAPLDYAAVPHFFGEPAAARWLGILIVELAVTVAVGGVMVSLFLSLTGGVEEP